jgi:hypothetical protein
MTALLILRGLPGSGKTTRALEYERQGYTRLEADQYISKVTGHENWQSGEYTQDELEKINYNTENRKAQVWLKEQVAALLPTKNLVVTGVFITTKQLLPFREIAQRNKSEYEVVTVEGKYQSVHKVPYEVYLRMAKNYQSFNAKTTDWTKEKKSAKAEWDSRVSKVVELLTYGMKPQAIWQYATEKTDWNVSIRTIHRYMAAATKILQETSIIDRELEIGKAMDRMDNLYQKNMAIQDYKAALASTRARIDLLGLAAPKIIKAEIRQQKSWAEFIAETDTQPGESVDVDEEDAEADND